MNLKDLIASDVTSVFLNEDEFAEPVDYTPKNGAARSITAVVRHNQEAIENEPIDYENETILVFVQRDEDGGIEAPQRGDELVRTNEPDQTPFGFSGRIISSDASAWTAEFKRPKVTTMGGQRRMLGRK